MVEESSGNASLRTLWVGAALTTVAAGLFPRLNAVIYEDVPIWRLDPEARVLFPVVLLLSLSVFVLLGRWAWRVNRGNNRPARVGLICGGLSIVGVVAFFLSLPIMLGGLALTLGLEGRKRAPSAGGLGQSNFAIALGCLGVVVGAAIWLLAAP